MLIAYNVLFKLNAFAYKRSPSNVKRRYFTKHIFSRKDFSQRIAAHFVQKLDFGAFSIFDYYLCANTS